MNYLAHAFLSNNDRNLLVGNFIADHVRGNNFSIYSKEIIDGIYLHREIDTFTDNHPLFKKSKRLFYDGFEKHSGILVDIYFDHMLASHFNGYSKVPLEEFSKIVYLVYKSHEQILPGTSNRFLDYVIQNNIYSSYATREGIVQVLYHLSHRIKHGVMLNDSYFLFEKNKKELESNFKEFFADAVERFIKNQI